MSIEQEIAVWDGKSADEISAVYKRHCEQPVFIAAIIKLTKDTSYQKGATWLLKAWLESGKNLEEKDVKEVYGFLHTLEHWETKLHILQCIPFMPIGLTERRLVEAFLRETLTDENKFVRAWSYNGFYVLSTQYPEYVEETKLFFEMAMRDEAASVKARIRNLIRSGF